VEYASAVACCAFAIFIVGQLAAGWLALRRAVPFARVGRPNAESALNPATAWQLGAPSAALVLDATGRGLDWRRVGRLALVGVALELALLAAGGAWLVHASSAPAHEAEAQRTNTLGCGDWMP